ncbi:MAG: response regulator transcription factor [Akkermansiaceae bacterium]|jgi:DNA-binding response OmpR family regulator|nr:response regulator transcription factor [Akkermansiaceae bacterium]
MRILLVEDSKRLRETVAKVMRRSGYRVDESGDGEEALWKARENAYDAIILDIMLPGRNGLEILETLRQERCVVPVLLLTARDTVGDRVQGLRQGADDYLCKPFALEELLARVEVLCRRGYGQRVPLIYIGDLEVDTVARRAVRAGHSLDLTAREFSLLELLALNPGAVLSRTRIEEHIYDDWVSPMSNVVDSTVYALRKKLAVTPELPQLIHTRRRQGYILEERSK